MNKYIVKYLRVSKDDSNAGESGSIDGQRRIIDAYISASAELAGIRTVEFADNGYTGMNFRRQGVIQLL